MKSSCKTAARSRAVFFIRILRILACSVFVWMGQASIHSAIEYHLPDAKSGSSQAVVVGKHPLAHTAQLFPLDAAGALVGRNDPAKQIEQTLASVEAVLRTAESGWDDLVKLNVYVARTGMVERVRAALAVKFTGPAKPAVSFVEGPSTHPDALVAMDAIALGRAAASGTGKRLSAAARPGDVRFAQVAILPAGPAVYVSGQAERGELAEATRKTMESLLATLSHLGLKRNHIVQLKAFMKPVSEAALVQKEMARFFEGELAPPLVFVEWISTQPIEIELIAFGDGGNSQGTETVSYFTPPGIKPSPIYSRVARVNGDKTIYISGLFGRNSESAETQIRDIFESLRGILRQTGSDFNHLVKATYYVATDEASAKLNELRPSYYDPQRPPAASKAMVKGVGLPGNTVTLDMIAVSAR
jgi:enamine deaminase RidA (YjgF/YER057c/UK114 family)